MLEILIHSMEVCVVFLSFVLVYRVRRLTNKYYLEGSIQQEDGGSAIVVNASNDTSHRHRKSEAEKQNHILSRLMGTSSIPGNETYETYETKIKALQQSQLFASTELIDIKRRFGNLESNSLDWLRNACAFYLIGAVSHIAEKEQCNIDDLEEITLLTLKSALDISKEEAYQLHYKAKRNTNDNDLHSTVKAGASAATSWTNGEAIPARQSLINQLENWGVIA